MVGSFELCQGDRALPDEIIALWKRPSTKTALVNYNKPSFLCISPAVLGDMRCIVTLAAPDLWPNNVSFSESPPNSLMFCLIHNSAKYWSRMPKLPLASGVPKQKNPKTFNRQFTVTTIMPSTAKSWPDKGSSLLLANSMPSKKTTTGSNGEYDPWF